MIDFHRKGQNAEFSADASDLFGRSAAPSEVQLYVSKSGNTRTFYFLNIERDREGDITKFIYETRDAVEYMIFTVFND